MAARSKARKRALDILFEADVRREPPLSVLEARMTRAEPPVSAYAIELVRGVEAHRQEIDRLLAENARGWTLDRMPAVDRNILRIGGYELLWGTEIPNAVAISEAVLLAGDLSTDGSAAFVNGLLARLLEIKLALSELPETPSGPPETPSGPPAAPSGLPETPSGAPETAPPGG